MHNIDSSLLLRRTALFLGMLMSGGLLIFPRVPILALIAVIALILRPRSLGIRSEMAPIALFFGAVLVLAGINDGFALLPLAIRFANFVGGVLLLGLYGGLPRDTLARDLDFLLRWMAYQACATFLLANAASGLFSPLVINETTYQTIYLVFTYHVMLEDPSLLLRPDGFFFEPGVLQFYLNLYLFITLFVIKSWRWVLLAIASVMVTQSTAGYLIMSALLGTAFYLFIKKNKASQMALTLTLGALISVPFGMLVYDNVQTKTGGILQGSSWAREYDLRTGIAVAAEHPWTGIGFDYDRYFEEARRLGYLETDLGIETITERPNSNGLIWLAVTMGFPMMLVMLYACYRQIYFTDRPLFFLIIAVSSLTEALLLTPFFLMFVYSGLLTVRRAASSPAGGVKRPLPRAA